MGNDKDPHHGITCYREGDLLRECWESVPAQTDDRWVVGIAPARSV